MGLDGFINADGFVTALRDEHHIPGAGNGFLQTGLAHACGMYPEPERLPELIARCRKSPECPLIWRSPWKKNPDDNQEHDDYFGALLFDEEWARDVLRYAEKTGWDFSIQDRDRGKLRFNFSRFLHFPAFVKVCAGEKASLTLWDKGIAILAMLFSCIRIGEADPNKKSFCYFRKMAPVIPGGEDLFLLWQKRVRSRYGKIGGAWAASIAPDHPLSQYNGENL